MNTTDLIRLRYLVYGAIITGIIYTLLSATANAGSVLATWTAPSTYADGTPLAPTDITGFNLYCSTATTGQPWSLIGTAPGNATSGTFTSCVGDGLGYFYATALANGKESNPSNIATKQFSSGAPLNPTIPACVAPPRIYVVYGYSSQTYVPLYDDTLKQIVGQAKVITFAGTQRRCQGDSSTVADNPAWLYTTDDETGTVGKALCLRWDL